MTTIRRTQFDDEVSKLGRTAMEERIAPKLNPEDLGKFVAIDVDTSDFEVDASDYSAVMRLRDRLPNARIWLARAGHPTAYKFRQRLVTHSPLRNA